jgi:hypothetical protein
VSPERSLLAAWYGGLLAGLLPILLLGFLYSAIADRIVFVGWSLVFAAAWVLVLRHGLGAGWVPVRLAGLLLVLLGTGFAVFAALEAKHWEILDLGFRAVLPGLYHPWATAPRTSGALAGLLGLSGVAAILVSLVATKRREAR